MFFETLRPSPDLPFAEFRRIERIEDLLNAARRNTDTVILHKEFEPAWPGNSG